MPTPLPTPLQPSLFASAGDDGVLKVLLELREAIDARQFIHNATLIEACNGAAAQAAIGALGTR